MKIDIAVYTAQEGYSWQPGSAITQAELREYKAAIGKFPSPDAQDMPFGGVFLKDGKVVFYRYHLAKKIDFRGRDALYCVLGAVPVAAAAKIDPDALFALPEFAGVVQPFPTEAELAEAEDGKVPEWLRGLEGKTLDVRIAESGGNRDYAVACESVKPPAPPPAEPAPVPDAAPGTAPASAPAATPAPARSRALSGKLPPSVTAMPKMVPWYRNFRMLAFAALLTFALSAIAIVLSVFFCRLCGPRTDKTAVKRTNAECKMENGKCKMENGKGKVENAECKVEIENVK